MEEYVHTRDSNLVVIIPSTGIHVYTNKIHSYRNKLSMCAPHKQFFEGHEVYLYLLILQLASKHVWSIMT